MPRRPIALLALVFLVLVLAGCTAEPEGAAPDASPSETADEATLAAATAKLQAQDPAGAAAILEMVTAREPKNAAAWGLYGRSLVLQEKDDEALAAYAKALEIDPTRDRAAYAVAQIHARQGDAEAALGTLERLRREGRFDLSQVGLDDAFAALRAEARYQDLLMKPEDFANPFVEETRVIHEWVGEAQGDQFGWIARNVGDVDGDDVADLVATAPTLAVDGGAGAGRVYVYSGKSGKLLWTASGEAGDQLGLGVEAAGDVDRDGIPDVVASAPGAGRAWVYRGSDGAVLLTLEGTADEAFGRHAEGAGDVDGDGHDDVLVGAPQNDDAGEDAGRAVLFSGKDGSVLAEWRGEEPGDRLGEAVAGGVAAGHAYVILGAPDAGDGDRGRVYVYGDLAEDGIEIAEPRFVIDSDDNGAELGGMFLSVIGDVDADGVADVYASDWSHNGKGQGSGKIVVHSGLDGRELLAIEGEAAGDGFGIGPADAGDVDGDGHDDLVVGAWQHASAAPAGGKVYLYSGKDGSLLRAWTCRVMGDTFGFDATGMGDVDGDGAIDLLLTSAWSAKAGPRSGRMFLVSAR